MDRSEQLAFCKQCTNRKFDASQGIICGLTDAPAAFEEFCPEYAPDAVAVHQQKVKDTSAQTGEKLSPQRESFKERLEIERAKYASQPEAERAVKAGASWFYWIAALSILNSIALLFKTDFAFIVGLGMSQLADSLMLVILGEYQVWSMIPSILLAIVFLTIGRFAHLYSRNAFIAGMILYGLDALIFLYFGDILSVGFHAFALFMIYKGFSRLKDVAESAVQAEQAQE